MLKKLKKGDYITFELLFKEYQPKLFAIACRILKDSEKAHEIVHDVFLNIWNNHKTIEIKKTLEAYLVVKVKGYSLNALRKNVKEKNLISETEISFFKLETEFYQNEDITSKMISDNLFNRFEEAMKDLPDQQQIIFRLSRIEGLTAGEIAEKTNTSKRTVETHIYNALKNLKIKLQDLLD